MFFRDTLRRLAQEQRVSGFARNRLDGTLEAAFEGEREAVERLVEFCRRGPARAHVARLERFDEDSLGETGFRVE